MVQASLVQCLGSRVNKESSPKMALFQVADGFELARWLKWG